MMMQPKSIAIITNYITAAIAEGLAERQAEKEEEAEEVEETNTREIKFDEGADEGKERRRGSGSPAGGKGRGAAGPQKRQGMQDQAREAGDQAVDAGNFLRTITDE